MPEEYRKSLTWDRSMELAKHSEITKEIVYQFISAIHNAHGSEVQMKILTVLLGSIFPKRLIYHDTLKID